jgi:hypothetical protein
MRMRSEKKRTCLRGWGLRARDSEGRVWLPLLRLVGRKVEVKWLTWYLVGWRKVVG